jgi:hypothetical protein
MVPSVFERENYCLALYELCPIFSCTIKGEDSYAKEMAHVLVGGAV